MSTNEPITYIQKGIKFVSVNRAPDEEKEGTAEGTAENAAESAAKKDIKQLLSAKNVHFLLGAGASTPAIPTMTCLQKEFDLELKSDTEELYERVKASDNGALNLEKILGILYSAQHAAVTFNEPKEAAVTLRAIESLIKEINEFLISKVSDAEDKNVIEYYKDFYKKIAMRNKDLARINIFTTNYDLFNETALDSLNFNYNSGFGGGLSRYFNPARFHYTLSQKLDTTLEKYEPVLDMIYLYKLHGSINWIRDDKSDSFFDVKEKDSQLNENENDRVLIYPTPLKEGETLASPYSDLMREFKTKLLLAHSTLFVIGYSFSDEHVNRIIYQALTVNPSLTIFVFGKEAGKLEVTGEDELEVTGEDELGATEEDELGATEEDELEATKEADEFEATGEAEKFEATGEAEKFEATGEAEKFEATGEAEKFEATGEAEKFEATGGTGDQRFYQLYSQKNSSSEVHYFKYIVTELLPSLEQDEDRELLEKFKKDILKL